MSLFEEITTVYPELTDSDFNPPRGSIMLQNDSDGKGDYIAKWDFSKPIPDGLKLNK